MFLQKVDFRQLVVVSAVAHIILVETLSISKMNEPKMVTIPLSFGFDSTKPAGGGALSGKYLPPSKQLAPKVVSTPALPFKKTSASVVDTTSIKQATLVPSLSSIPSSSNEGSAQGSGGGAGTGHGPGIGSGSGGVNTAKAKYFTDIVKLIENNKKYPTMAKRLGQYGMVLVKLTLDKNGKIVELEVKDGVRFSSLREASLKAIESVGTFPSIPTEFGVDTISFNVPIKYQLD